MGNKSINFLVVCQKQAKHTHTHTHTNIKSEKARHHQKDMHSVRISMNVLPEDLCNLGFEHF